MKPEQIRRTRETLISLENLTKKLLKDPLLKPAFQITLFQLNKDIKAAHSFWANLEESSQKIRDSFLSKKLQIGGGKHCLKGFVNLDIFPPADMIWDCRYGLPFKKESFNLVFSEHFFEHIDFPISAKKILREIYRTMEPGGTLILGVPDGGKVTRAYYAKNKKFLGKLRDSHYSNRHPPVEINGDLDLVNYLFRDQIDNPDYSIHYWAYDEVSLGNLLLSVGFRKVKKADFNSRYCNPKRKSYTLYVEAKK